MDLILKSNVKRQSKPAIHTCFAVQPRYYRRRMLMCPGRSPQPIPSTAYGVSFTRLLWRSNFRAGGRKGEGRSACPNSIFSGRYRADVTSDTRGSSPGRMPFRIIGGRGRMVIRRRGRLIIKFILFTGAKGKLNYTPHHILLETVSFLCDFFFFSHISSRWLVYSVC